MIAADTFRSSATDEDDGAYTMFSRSSFIAGIGDNLRGLYGEVASGAQPDYLLELAIRIDDRRSSDG